MLKLPKKTSLSIWFIREEIMARITEEQDKFSEKKEKDQVTLLIPILLRILISWIY